MKLPFFRQTLWELRGLAAARPSLCTICAAAILASASTPARAQSLVISEFMASNLETLNDEDGDSEDWIELLNQSGSALNLEGWFLTDDMNDLKKWPFPSVVLDPGAHVVVFASDKDRRDPGGELHTNFKLTSDGEYLALVRPDGATVEHEYGPAYPVQVQDVSYGLLQSASTTTLIAPDAAVKFTVPTNGDHDVDEGTNPDSWIGTDFPDDGWTTGTAGLGYATGTPDAYDGLITTDVQDQMFNGGTSIYIRIPFEVEDPDAISGLTLKMKYDDGFVAYLNGDPLPLAEANSPSPDQLDFESTATTNHNDTLAVEYELFPLDTTLLNVGTNVLCVHGLNQTSSNSDALWVIELEATSPNGSAVPTYFTSPTPNDANAGGSSAPGPVIRSVTKDLPPLDLSSDSLVIEVEVLQTVDPISTVNLTWQVMYERENLERMKDDGTGDDALAEDGIYTATIPTDRLGPGEMIRWKVTATDTERVSTTQPPFPDPNDSPEYFGTIAEDPSLVSSNLPIFHWFTANPNGANNPSPGSRGSVYYLGQFYDNILADRHGQSTGGFPKKSYDFDFNKGDRFLYQEGERRVKDINMLTNWADKAKVRNTLGYEIMRNAGHPAHYAFPVRIQQNAEFFSVADLVEDGDDRYLDRVGLDGEGALYKMYNRLDSSSSGVNKKTRKRENNNDLQRLINGLGRSGDAKLRYGYDNVNIPGTINYLAALDLTNNRDHGHKNYYLYRDTNGTGEWRPLVWDIDLCLGRNWVSGPAYFDDTFTNNGLRAGPSNRLKTLIFGDPILNQMYLRRMRSLIDEQLGSPEEPVTYLDDRVNELVALIDPNDDNPSGGSDDADLDWQKWGSWGNRFPMRRAAGRITGRKIPGRAEGHLAARREQFAALGELPASQPTAPPIRFGPMDYNPVESGASSDQSGEFISFTSRNNFAVDMSDWVISGGVSLTLPPGTVIPARGRLYVAREAVGFRARSTSPKANEKILLVSGYAGQLSARGETVVLSDDAGNEIATLTYPGDPTPGQQFLRITEILYAPVEPSPAELASMPALSASDFEFVELTNTGETALDIGEAQFIEGIVFTFPEPTVLEPGEHILVVANQAAFELRHGAGLNIAGEYTGKLDNDGEQLQILDAAGENILEFTYNDAWYAPTDDHGYSLVALDPANTPVTDFDRPRNWGISLAVNGDPGSASTGIAMHFDFWKHREFSEEEVEDPLVTGPEINLDSDILTTVLEYAFGRNPRLHDASESYLASTVDDGGTDYHALTFRRQKNALDLTYTVEMSSNLLTWNEVSTVVGSPTDNGDGTETVTIRDSSPAATHLQRFARLRIVISP